MMTIFYAGIQFCFWFLFGTVNNFSSVFLLENGLTNSQIGLTVAAACGLSVFIQPALASYADRENSPSLKKLFWGSPVVK